MKPQNSIIAQKLHFPLQHSHQSMQASGHCRWSGEDQNVRKETATLPTHSENWQACGHCSPATTTLSCPTFRDTVCPAGQGTQEHFQALPPSTTPSSGLNPRMASSVQGKREVLKNGSSRGQPWLNTTYGGSHHKKTAPPPATFFTCIPREASDRCTYHLSVIKSASLESCPCQECNILCKHSHP